MPTFVAPVLDRFLESGNTSSITLLRNSFDPESLERPVTANPRNENSMNGNYSKLEVRSRNLPPNPYLIRGTSVPPNPTSEKDGSLSLNPNLENRVGIPTTRKHERGASLSSVPNLENNCNFLPNPKLDRGSSLPLNTKLERGLPISYQRNGSSVSAGKFVERKDHWTEISPALYATPVATPLPDSPSQFSPSPYIINHKRRGPRLMKSFSEEDVLSCQQSSDALSLNKNGDVAVASKDGDSSKPVGAQDFATVGICADEHGKNDKEAEIPEKNSATKFVEFGLPNDSDNEHFVEPHDSVSVRSIAESEGYPGTERNLNPATPLSEFYDAWEELSSESGYQLSTPRTENELRGIRMSLLMEIEKRKQAEEALNNMRNQWRRILDQLSDVGIRLPEAPTPYPSDEQPSDYAFDICQQVLVSRFVSESIGRGLAKAEEEEMEAQISMKNTEIARLSNKLRYYEAVNREMSQRNQEIVETSRRLRQRRKRRQKWIWGSIATAATLITASLAYSYFQSGTPLSSSESLAPMAEQKPSE